MMGQEEGLQEAENQEQGTESRKGSTTGTDSGKLSSRGLASVSSSLKTQTFYEATQRGAGTVIRSIDLDDMEREAAVQRLLTSEVESEIYTPFKSQEDYTYSEWFATSKCSQTQINTFLRNPFLNNREQDRFSFQNAAEWKYSISQIPYGIQNDHWKSREMTIRKHLDGVQNVKTIVYYRVIVAVLRLKLSLTIENLEYLRSVRFPSVIASNHPFHSNLSLFRLLSRSSVGHACSLTNTSQTLSSYVVPTVHFLSTCR